MIVTPFAKRVVLLNCAVPAILLAWDAVQHRLGANPVDLAIRTTGMLTIIFLLLSLTVTPLVRLFGFSWLGTFRRSMGVSAFAYAAIHLGLYFFFDRAANVVDAIMEIGLRKYLLVGIIGFLILLPLAATSTDGMIRKLGAKRWKRLHLLAYVAAIAGVLHFYLLVKADTTRPLIAMGLLGLLFAYRIVAHQRKLHGELKQLRSASVSPQAANESVTTTTSPASTEATLEFAHSGRQLRELNGRTILELAEANGISIPYDCRAAVCGQCKTRVLSGNVVMDADDALDVTDRANGVVLACQARCRDAVVVDR